MQNQHSITHQIHTGRDMVDGTVELEFIYTRMLTGKIARLDIIAILSIVDFLAEGDGRAGFGEVVAQFHCEGNFLDVARRSRGTSQTSWSSGSCVKKDRVQLYQQNLPIIAVLQYFKVIL